MDVGYVLEFKTNNICLKLSEIGLFYKKLADKRTHAIRSFATIRFYLSHAPCYEYNIQIKVKINKYDSGL